MSENSIATLPARQGRWTILTLTTEHILIVRGYFELETDAIHMKLAMA